MSEGAHVSDTTFSSGTLASARALPLAPPVVLERGLTPPSGGC